MESFLFEFLVEVQKYFGQNQTLNYFERTKCIACFM